MITSDELRDIGTILKTHGIKGELSCELYQDIDLLELSCVVLDIDGIFVPFFISEIRPKSADSILIQIDDIDCEIAAKSLVGKTIYVKMCECENPLPDDDDMDGIYAEDCVGYTINDSEGRAIGDIVDYDDTTENVLFIVQPCNAKDSTFAIPVALMTNFDQVQRTIIMDIPEGLTEL